MDETKSCSTSCGESPNEDFHWYGLSAPGQDLDDFIFQAEEWSQSER